MTTRNQSIDAMEKANELASSGAQVRATTQSKKHTNNNKVDETPDGVRELQRRAGNRATSQLLSIAQPQLKVGPVGDRYEREADSVAARVVAALQQSASAGQPATASPEGTVARKIQRRSSAPEVGYEGGELSPGIETDINSARSGGAPLDVGTRRDMEGAFGTDFSGVRVHTNATATALNEQIQAKAFTVGSDIFFNGPAPDASTPGGQELLAHELTHTVQQQGGSAGVQRFSLFGKKKKPTAEEVAKKEEVVESKRLKGEKELGTKQREQTKQKITDDPKAEIELRKRFDDAIDEEKTLKAKLVKGGMDVEDAETQAYAKIWLAAAPDLRAIRPMRETRAEKLVSKTVEMRGEQATEKGQKQGMEDSRGSLVSKAVEDLMVKEVLLVRDMLKLMVPLDEAKQEAYETVWSKADPKVVAKRPPVGSKLEAKAYEIAEKRAGLHTDKEKGSSDVLGLVGKVGGGAMKVTGDIGARIKKGSDDGNKKTLSTGEKAGGGIESISNMVTGVLDSIVGIRDFIVLVNDLTKQKSVDFNDIGSAIKAGLGEISKLNSNVSSAMKIAGALSESALASVADMIPIVDVIGNAIAVASGLADTVPNAMRYGSNLGDIYLARSGERPELVLPLQRLGRRNFQMLEKSFADTTFAITKLSLGIAQLATAGADFGATTAIKTAVQVIQAAHSLGHFIADEVYAVQAKDARKGFTGKTEGSAEQLLKKDASYAIDALITAALKGDKKSQWLARGALKDSYGIEFTTGDSAEIAAAHDRILKILKESDEPKTTLDKLKDGVKSVKTKAGGLADKAVDVGTLAKSREAEDGKKRGFGWKMKMWFKSEGALARRIAQQNAKNDTELESSKQKKGSKYKSKGEDPNISTPKVQQALIDEMDDMTLDELQAAAKDPTRSQFEQIVFSQAAAEKLKLEMQGTNV